MKPDDGKAHYKEHPIYGTDFTKPVSVLIEDARNTISHARGQLQDIAFGTGWEDRVDHVIGLLTCGLVALAESNEEIIKFEKKHPTIHND